MVRSIPNIHFEESNCFKSTWRQVGLEGISVENDVREEVITLLCVCNPDS